MDGPNVSTSLKPTQPDTEEGAVPPIPPSTESVDSGTPPAVPHDHTYTSVGIQVPDSTNPSTQQPSSSTSGSPPLIPSGAPSQTVATSADDEGHIDFVVFPSPGNHTALGGFGCGLRRAHDQVL